MTTDDILKKATKRPDLDEKTVMILARREWDNAWVANGCKQELAADYLNSLDALRPVLAKMSKAEWNLLLLEPIGRPGFSGTWAEYYLTMDTRKLARAVANVIALSEKKETPTN